MDNPAPYIRFVPGETVTADGFNGLQCAALGALEDHTHEALPGDALDPAATLAVRTLEVGALSVAGRDPVRLGAERVSRAGGLIDGDLEVQGRLNVGRLQGAIAGASRPRVLTFVRGDMMNSNRYLTGNLPYPVQDFENFQLYTLAFDWYPTIATWTPLAPFFVEPLELEVPSYLTLSILGVFESGVRAELLGPGGERSASGSDLVDPNQSDPRTTYRYDSQSKVSFVLASLTAPRGRSTLSLYCRQSNYPGFMLQVLVTPIGGSR